MRGNDPPPVVAAAATAVTVASRRDKNDSRDRRFNIPRSRRHRRRRRRGNLTVLRFSKIHGFRGAHRLPRSFAFRENLRRLKARLLRASAIDAPDIHGRSTGLAGARVRARYFRYSTLPFRDVLYFATRRRECIYHSRAGNSGRFTSDCVLDANERTLIKIPRTKNRNTERLTINDALAVRR